MSQKALNYDFTGNYLIFPVLLLLTAYLLYMQPTNTADIYIVFSSHLVVSEKLEHFLEAIFVFTS